MPLLSNKAVAVCLLPTLVTAFQLPPRDSMPACVHCIQESLLLEDSSWDSPSDLSQARAAAAEGGMLAADVDALLDGIHEAAGRTRGAFIVTVTDGGMVDLAQNMIRSLDAVPSHAPRLVVGMGSNICAGFEVFHNTTCVEVFKDAGSEDEVAWGSHAYWQVVFRKHVILTVTAISNVSRNVIYTDPDIAYLDSPVGYLVGQSEHHDITFSPNNMLEPDARGVQDLAETYERRGMENITLGPHGRRVDINTGLFHMRSSSTVTDLMRRTMRIFKAQEFVHGHYQQFSLVTALRDVPTIRIGVGAGDVLVNGNVFWGHRGLLRPARVVSVHANWMDPELKRPCLRSVGFWIDPSEPHPSRLTFAALPNNATMDDRSTAVVDCKTRVLRR